MRSLGRCALKERRLPLCPPPAADRGRRLAPEAYDRITHQNRSDEAGLRMAPHWFAAIVIVSIVASLTQPCQAAVESPSPQVTALNQSVDPRITARAKEWFHRFQGGQIDRSQLDAKMNAELTNTMIEQETARLRQVGAPSSFRFIRTYAINGVIGYDFLLQFGAARIVEMIAFDPDGKIAGIDFMTFVRDGDR
ncbi:MAG: hypothetical protein WBV40_08045 [Candidatus Cybelea sp.]|jgi:hypothetical protein